MSKTITISPVVRIEGHAKITLQLDEDGKVHDANLHVTQLRGFEKLAQGRPFSEMPSLMARTCGICPVAHLIAGAKACDEILAVRIPETANNLRKIINLAQILQSHALNFFHLSSPDFLLGFDSDPANRNIFGLMNSHPEMARNGIALRKFGQQIIESLGGKRIHPSWIVPGGLSHPLSQDVRDSILKDIPANLKIAEETLSWFKKEMENFKEEIKSFGNFPSIFMGLVDKETGALTFYDGYLRFVDANGKVIADKVDCKDYQKYIGESVEPFSYLKSPYYKPLGYPGGMYRVGPLARLNVADNCRTPKANQELIEFKELQRGSVLSSFYYHYARLIEILYCVERLEQLLTMPNILDEHVRSFASPNDFEGVGAAEAPRGTLFHHYKIDENGLITWANLIIASGNNNLAMNKSILQVAKVFVDGNNLKEGMLNRVEAVIRAYDPCLSCSTHAVGKMPLQISLIDPDGNTISQISRS